MIWIASAFVALYNHWQAISKQGACICPIFTAHVMRICVSVQVVLTTSKQKVMKERHEGEAWS